MPKYHIRIVGGSCGSALVMITNYLGELIVERLGYDCRVTHQNIWESFGPPPEADLILQTMPAYSQSDTDIPIINIRPLITELDHGPTIEKILDFLKQQHENSNQASATDIATAPIVGNEG
jgi:hypothetical protein